MSWFGIKGWFMKENVKKLMHSPVMRQRHKRRREIISLLHISPVLTGLKWKLNKEILPNIKLQLDWHQNQQQRTRMADNNWRAEKVQNGNRGVWCLGGSWNLRVPLASLNTHPISQIISKVQDCYKWILVPLPTEDNTWCHKSIPKFLFQKIATIAILL